MVVIFCSSGDILSKYNELIKLKIEVQYYNKKTKIMSCLVLMFVVTYKNKEMIDIYNQPLIQTYGNYYKGHFTTEPHLALNHKSSYLNISTFIFITNPSHI